MISKSSRSRMRGKGWRRPVQKQLFPHFWAKLFVQEKTEWGDAGVLENKLVISVFQSYL